ncbi:MAG: conjugal transfer protein TrbC [Desulfuromonadales bacterium]|nr:conjugal transfer protein TrbC [Desulfuromonadales bacterium]
MNRFGVAMLVAGMALVADIYRANGADVFVDTPDLCSRVEKAEGNRIYLVSKGECPQTPGKLAVPAGQKSGELEIYVNGAFWKKQALARFDLDSIGNLHTRGDKLSKTLTIPPNSFEKQGAVRAKETDALFRSDEFQKRVATEQERLKREIFGGRIQEYYQGDPEAAAAMAGQLPVNERIYIFISSSMPRATLRNYVRDVARLKDPNVRLVMRGLVGGVTHITPTMGFISAIILKDTACDPEKSRCQRYAAGVNVDPLLFRKYGIDQVPAIVYGRNLTVLDPGMSEGLDRNLTSGESYTIQGDVALGYALERFQVETGSRSLEALITQLKAGFYEGK